METSLLSYAELNVDMISIYKKLPFNVIYNFIRRGFKTREDVKLPVVEASS